MEKTTKKSILTDELAREFFAQSEIQMAKKDPNWAMDGLKPVQSFGGGRFVLITPIELAEGAQRLHVFDMNSLPDGIGPCLLPRDLIPGLSSDKYAMMASAEFSFYVLAENQDGEVFWQSIRDGEIVINILPPTPRQMSDLPLQMLNDRVENEGI